MITIYKSRETALETLTEPENNCWINVIDPGDEEINLLTRWEIPHDFITYSLDLDERARTEREDNGGMLILIRIPYFQGLQFDVPYITIPMGVITTKKYIVTICRRENEILQEMTSGRVQLIETNKRNRFILRMLLIAAGRYLNHLRKIDRIVDTIEDRLQVSQRNRELVELVKYQKSLVYFTTALRSNELMMERLQRWQLFRMFPEDEDLLEDVITENQQAIEMVNISTNILSSTLDAFASIISNNMNSVMKFLASATVVVSLPTMIFSYFGMNVPIPSMEHGLMYLGILMVSILVSIIVILVFLRKDWF